MKKKKIKPINIILKILAYLFTLVCFILVDLIIIMNMLVNGPSPSARNTFVATMLETGNMKFVISWFLSEEEVLAITNNTSSNQEVVGSNDTSLITITNDASTDEATTDDNNFPEDEDGDGIILVPIAGRTFGARLLIVRDPSKVSIASCYPFSSMARESNGYTVGEYAEMNNAIAAVNAGEFETPSGINWGGRPVGVVVEDNEVRFAEPHSGDVMVGFNDDNVLVIKALESMNADSFATYVAENHIRDGASFKDISDGNNNHFTMLIMNGEPVDLGGRGGGANPRTAIGQCQDGTVLILVTDGRGSAGHLGATANDLTNIMLEYGAVNAANLDGGSSSSMYFDHNYEITSSYLPNSDASRRMPTAIVVAY